MESLIFMLLPPLCLTAAGVARFSPDPHTRSAALPLLLAALVVTLLDIHLRRTARRAAGAGPTAPQGPEQCESCRQIPGTIRVQFPDGAAFRVCATCLAAGCLHTNPKADPRAVPRATGASDGHVPASVEGVAR